MIYKDTSVTRTNTIRQVLYVSFVSRQESEWSYNICVRGIDYVPFYQLSIAYWNCLNSVIYYWFFFILILKKATIHTTKVFNYKLILSKVPPK
jgi:hypothetical protein